MLKRTYSLGEAAEFLSTEFSVRHTEQDVIEAAAHGDLRLCAWFEGTVAAFQEHPFDDPTLLFEGGAPTYWHKCQGYAEVPRELIRPGLKQVEFFPVNILSIAWSEYADPPQQVELAFKQSYMLFEFLPETGLPEVIPVRCEISEARVPTTDLLMFDRNRQRSRDGAATSETVRQNKLLAMIAALLDQLHIEPSERGAARRIEEFTEHVGSRVTEETVKKYLDMIPEVLGRAGRKG